MRNNSHSRGFDARRQNKYSIRRFTVGTASIIVGATLLFGIGNEARAAEGTTDSTGNQTSGSSTSDPASQPTEDAAPTQDAAQTQETQSTTVNQSTDQLVDKTAEPTAPQTDTKTTDAPTTGETVTPEQNTTTNNDTNTTTTSDAPQQDTSSQTASSTDTSSTTKDTSSQSAPESADTTTSTTQEKSTSDTSSQSSTSDKVDAPTTSAQEPSSTTQEKSADTSSTSNTTSAQTAEEPVTTQGSTDQTVDKSTVEPSAEQNTVSSTEPTQQVIAAADSNTTTDAGTTQDTSLQSSDLAAQAGVTSADSPELATYKLLQQSSDNKDANTIQTTAETTPMSRSFSLMSASPTTFTTLAAATGTNVNDLVTISNPTISTEQIDPNQSGNFRLNADYTVNGTVQGGDYFTVQMPTYANMDGELDYTNTNNQFTTELLSPSGYVVANGVYDTTTKTLTYTFTDWVNDKEDVSGSFSLAQFADRNTAKDYGTYPLTYNLAGETFNTQITYAYDSHEHGVYPAYVDSMITNVDATNTTNDFTEVVYVNPTDLNLSSAALVMAPKDGNSNALIGFDYTTFHIYEVPDPSQLPDSYDFEAAGYQDLAQSFQNNGSIYTNANGDMIINFGAIDNPYVVVMDSQFDPTYSSNLTTRATLYATDQSGYTASYFFDNSFVIENSSGTGDGTLETYRLGDYVWEDTNQNGIQDSGETPISNVLVTLKDANGNIINTAVTDRYGNYLFSDLNNGDYTVEFSTPEGYVPTTQNAGTDSTVDSNGLVVPVTINGADNLTIDSGFYKPVAATYNLGDYVWEDSNKDGIQNSNEVGIEGVTVTLTKPDGTTETTVTGADGKYEFTGLENGEYTVNFSTPAGYEATLVNQGDLTALDSNGTTTTVVINNADDYTIDSGFFKPVVEPEPVPATYNLGDYVWEDSNKDGIQNSNEVGIEGVTVTLTKPDGSTVTTVTDANGKYEFTGLENGDYTVDFTAPEGYEATLVNVGDDALDSDGASTTVTINNADNYTIDSGFFKPAVEEPTPVPATYNLGDYVWEDSNKDGIQNSNEVGIEGVTVTLTKPDGSTVTTVTDANGKYEFTGLENGDYTVDFTAPEGYEATLVNVGDDALDSDGASTTVTINNADNYTIDSGFFKPAVEEPTPVPATYNLGDYVWEDSNKDGIQNSNEVGIEGVTVTLTKPDGSTVTTVTDANGKYEFTGLENGDYTVDFTAPEGYEATLVNVGDDALDSDGASTTVTINNADNYTIDSGFYKPVVAPEPVPATYNLGDYVWEDSNKDGIQNSNEVGIEGVTVTLTKPDGSTVTTVTDANGKYEFTGLENGDYTVDFTAPEGYEATLVNVGDDALDSDGASTTVTINNADNYTIDSGFYKPVVAPEPVPATYNLGDYVWEDSNKDGIQNSNEVGIEGVTVTLTKPDGSTVTTVTDANGKYEFTGLENGDYTVDFTAPEGYEATLVNVGDDALDSDGASTTVTINNADNYTIDSGFYKPVVAPEPVPATYNLGDYVWEDSNKDGIQNSNEVGIEGVTVTLTKPDGSTVTTVTDANGKYEFTGLENGDYTVDFTAPEGYEATLVNVGDDALDSDGASTTVTINNADNYTIDSGFYKPVVAPEPVPATYNLGDYVWEDSNKDGIQNSNEVGIEGVTVTLTKPDGSTVTTVTDANGKYEFTGLENGDYTVDFTAPEGYEATLVNVGDDALDSDGASTTVTINNADNYTIDSGFFKPAVEEPTPVPATYNLGDYVWEDSNKDGIQNSNEVGIEGVTVTLIKPDGSTVTTVTDANGKYEFTGLENGDYTVDFTAPEGYEATLVNVGDDALDSDGASTTVTINNADNYTIDSGFYKPVQETPQEPATYTVGDKVWEDTNKDGVQNSNEPGIPGVEVTLTKPDGSTVTTTTDGNGNYEFTNLPNGDYTITFETPEGYEPTTPNVGNPELDSNGTTTTVTVNNGDDKTIDSGFYKPVQETPQEPATYTVGDKVWEDTNKDGIQNSNEPGIPGVEVTLTKPDGSTVTTTTDENGNYEFTNLPNGEYTITFETPEGYEPTLVNVGNTALDSDGKTVTVIVNNADDKTIDSGFYKPVVEPTPEDPTPEEPGTPEKPEEPTTPEEPGTPEKPEVPTTPEEPGTPEKPEVPTTPEEPGTPEKPEVPTTPEEPTAPAVTPAPSVEQPAVEKQEKPSEEASSKEKEEALPDTGETESTNNAPLFGGLFAALGSILLFGRRRKDNKDKQ
ncbi:SdrD B-like domain-containing protein [Staphylococcus simulans]|uniref:SdrD B-like domain-containing protein n=1 Tax=Staphylococcus simulans TaxID=1286 RepID=UPI000F6E106C|nr:SdrD B-like domain-containing protein [Staphylococcus simulans]VED59399.1 Ser-Asp rich fibrinogen/bone sialoprotein-binding protein SdrD [Staphylococcus simulans]